MVSERQVRNQAECQRGEIAYAERVGAPGKAVDDEWWHQKTQKPDCQVDKIEDERVPEVIEYYMCDEIAREGRFPIDS